jgi:methionyl-tRNA formyltransferase
MIPNLAVHDVVVYGTGGTALVPRDIWATGTTGSQGGNGWVVEKKQIPFPSVPFSVSFCLLDGLKANQCYYSRIVRTLFIGGTRRGYLTLKALIDAQCDLVGVISLRQDEHEVERYGAPIRALAEERGIPLYETKWMKDRDYVGWLRDEVRPDIAFIVGCRILIDKDVYEIPRLGSLAVHDSMLPRYRGFAPLNWSILNGEPETGVTLFYLSEKMDHGDIVGSRAVPIKNDDTAPAVYERVCEATTALILEALPALAAGSAPRIHQEEGIGTYGCSRSPSDGVIDWSETTLRIYNKIRALTYPYPGAFTHFEGETLTVWTASLLSGLPEYVGRIPGRVVAVSQTEGWIDVLTGDGVLRVTEVQAAGGEKCPAASVVRSVRAKLGLDLVQLLQRIQKIETRIGPLFTPERS